MTHKLLVIDDNTTVQRVITLAFQDEPITVSTMTSGGRGFEEIEANPPDIVLADNGREVAAFLKSRPKLSHIPVVLLKGAFDPATEGPDQLAGCDDALMKPLQPQRMIDCVKQLLREQKPGVRRAPAPAVKRIDADLTLEQYFDQLNAAFSRTESTTRQLPGDSWLWEHAVAFSRGPLRQQQESAAKDVPHEGQKPPKPSAADKLTDEFVEQLTQGKLDRLGGVMTRSTATEIVSRLSRWLLVDEVERAKQTK
jgi:CheY-like chemotaxis protein